MVQKYSQAPHQRRLQISIWKDALDHILSGKFKLQQQWETTTEFKWDPSDPRDFEKPLGFSR